jgi:hypothetical protein
MSPEKNDKKPVQPLASALQYLAAGHEMAQGDFSPFGWFLIFDG